MTHGDRILVRITLKSKHDLLNKVRRMHDDLRQAMLRTVTNPHNRIGGVMVSVLASGVVDRGFESRSGQTKDYTIGICRFSAKHAALRRKSKDWLARNQNNVSEWSEMLFQ